MTRLAILLSLLLGLWACSGTEVDPAPIDEFAARDYRYYAWRSEPLQQRSGPIDLYYEADPVIRAAVDRELETRGYRLDPDRAEFLVDYFAASGARSGQLSGAANNIDPYPSAVINRGAVNNQAAVDNAYAMAGPRDTANVAVIFFDATSKNPLWRVTMSKLVENANRVDRDGIRNAISQGFRTVPEAGQP